MANVIKPSLKPVGGNVQIKTYGFNDKPAAFTKAKMMHEVKADKETILPNYGDFEATPINPELRDVLTEQEGKVESLLSKYHIFDIEPIPEDERQVVKPEGTWEEWEQKQKEKWNNRPEWEQGVFGKHGRSVFGTGTDELGNYWLDGPSEFGRKHYVDEHGNDLDPQPQAKPEEKPQEQKPQEKPQEEKPKEEPKKENRSTTNSLPSDWKSPYSGHVDDQRTVYEYLKNEGYSDAAIAGIMGNIACESGFNPNSSYMEKTGYSSNGIIQWNSQYVPKSAIGNTTEEQLDYLCHNFSGFSESEKEYLKSLPNTEAGAREAAAYFDKKVEVSDGSMRNQRMNYAAQYYNSFN